MTVGEQLTALQKSFDDFKRSFDEWKEAQMLRCEDYRTGIWQAINRNRLLLLAVALGSAGAGSGITAAILEVMKR